MIAGHKRRITVRYQQTDRAQWPRRNSTRAQTITRPRPAEPADSDGDLPAALSALRQAVDRLTAERTALINGQPVVAPRLVDQVADSIAGRQGTGNHQAARSPPNVWVDAVDLLNDMDTALRIWERNLPPFHIPPAIAPATTVQRIRALADRRWRPQDTGRVQKLRLALVGWARDIDELLHPPRRMSLAGGLPGVQRNHGVPHRCGRRPRTRAGPAKSTLKRGCICLACKASWGPERFLFLCEVLGFSSAKCSDSSGRPASSSNPLALHPSPFRAKTT